MRDEEPVVFEVGDPGELDISVSLPVSLSVSVWASVRVAIDEE